MDLSIRDRSFGVCSLDGKRYGVGPGYRIEFGQEGCEYVPVLGLPAKPASALRFRLESVGRRDHKGELRVRPVQSATPGPRIQGNLVSYERGNVVETYEARISGVEQCFVLRTLPPGSGDLVVRVRIETDLPLAVDRNNEKLFEIAGVGGVRIGAVTGIDARGERTPGTLRLDQGVLELALPAGFVDKAVLPLVVDPLIGTTLSPGGWSNVTSVDVAYDATNDVYLVAWLESASVYAQRVSPSGGPVGGRILIDAATSTGPVHVANINRSDMFVVVAYDTWGISAWAVHAATASVSSPVVVATPTLRYDVTLQCVAGDARPSGDTALVAWLLQPLTAGRNKTIVQELTTVTGTLSLGRLLPLGSGCSVSMSKSGGAAGRWLLALAVQAAHPSLVVLDPSARSIASIPFNAGMPVIVDGDGTSWALAYAATSTGGSSDVACRGVSYAATSSSSGTLSLGPEVLIEADPGESEWPSSVAWTGGSALVGFVDNGAMHVRSIDGQSCLGCEGEFVIDPAASSTCAIASQKSGDPAAGDGALIVWTSAGRLQARLFRADDGIVSDLGGGCGQGGVAYASCARVANAGFAPQLRGAAPAAPLWLGLGAGTIRFPCGSCTIVPDVLAGLIAGARSTDAQGNGSLAMPIPSDPALNGATFTCQWIVASTQAACGLGFDLSNALQVQIQQ